MATPHSISQPPRPPTHNSRGVAGEPLRVRAPDRSGRSNRAPTPGRSERRWLRRKRASCVSEASARALALPHAEPRGFNNKQATLCLTFLHTHARTQTLSISLLPSPKKKCPRGEKDWKVTEPSLPSSHPEGGLYIPYLAEMT